MNVKQLYSYLNQKIPPSLSAPWDNDGLMCCPDPDREVRRVLISLDLTGEVADEAVEGDFDAVLTHHPLIFNPIKSLTCDSSTGAKLISLVGAGISVMSFHTRLDAVEGGVNDILAEALGLKNISPLPSPDGEIGRVGELCEPCSLDEFALAVKSALGAPSVVVASAGHTVSRVAVLGGAGGDDIAAARESGADTYVTGELKYHQLADPDDAGINLIAAGHFYTEDPVCDRLAELVAAADGNIEIVYKKSCNVKVL